MENEPTGELNPNPSPDPAAPDPVNSFDPKAELSGFKAPPTAFLPGEFAGLAAAFPQSHHTNHLPVLLGTGNQVYWQDLAQTPNILLAGTIGTGKTQFIYNQALLWVHQKHPGELKLVICGSKTVDYQVFQLLGRHYLAAPEASGRVIEPRDFPPVLKGLAEECQNRLNLFIAARVRHIREYNAKFVRGELAAAGHHYLQEMVILIDDLYDFLAYEHEQVSAYLVYLTANNLNTGLYVIAVTSQINSSQITGQLKSNFNFRIALKLMSQSESKKILDKEGAEKLKMPGQTLFFYNGRLTSAQQPFFDDSYLKETFGFIANQRGFPSPLIIKNGDDLSGQPAEFDPDSIDPLFDESARLVVLHQQGSTSLIQRKLKLGYNRAGRIIDQLEAAGIVGPFEGSKAREVLFADEYTLEKFLESLHPQPEKPVPGKPATVKSSPEAGAPPKKTSLWTKWFKK